MKIPAIKTDKTLLKGSAVSFLIPLAVMLFGFALREIAPFGERTLCSMDGFSQYWPMLENMSDAIRNGEVFYSFNGALGFNLWAQSAYYTNSPLWVLVYILPHGARLTAINLLVVFKLCLSALFFYLRLYFTHDKAEKLKKTLVFPCLSIAWALSGYMLAFINQLMWTDVIMLLPLVVWGLEMLFKKHRPALYIMTLFLSMWSCFYLSYMVCIFAVLYFLYLTFREKISFRDFLCKGVIFAVSSILSAGMAAVVLIPVFKALGLTLASDLGFEGTLSFKYGFSEMLFNFLPFRKPSLEYGAPNLYFGIISLVILICGLFSKRTDKRKKLLAAAFLLFMLVTMSLNLGDFVWHGFHYPNQLPGRQSFIFIFLALSFAGSFISVSGFRKGTIKLLCAFLLFEICFNGVGQVASGIWASKSSSLNRYDSIMSEFTPLQQEADFQRIEFADVKKNNGTQQYSFRGVTYYSSTMTADAYNFFQAIGQPRYAKNVSVYYEQSDITNALFGIRHVLTEKKTKLDNGEDKYDFTITENENALPLAFLCSDEIVDFNPENYEAGEETQKALWLALTENDEISFSEQAKELQQNGMEITNFDTDLIEGKINAGNGGVLMTTIPDDGGWKIYVDGEEAEKLKLADYFCGVEITEGEHEIKMVYTVPGIKSGTVISVVSLILTAAFIMIMKRKAVVCRKNGK
ncbi:MAG: YfhO family protein [Clostridia bacterium]|nr:YfhO family protein [Clostridia bacterium]